MRVKHRALLGLGRPDSPRGQAAVEESEVDEGVVEVAASVDDLLGAVG